MNRKFGIEIEAYGVTKIAINTALNAAGIICHIEGYNHETRPHWKIVSDASLSGDMTFELVSPILEGVNGLEQVMTVGNVLEQIGAKVNKSCGLHVHIDGRDLTVPQLSRVCKMWLKYESCFDSIVPESRRNNPFCKAIRAKFASLEAAFKAIDGAVRVRDLTQVMNSDRNSTVYTSRYHKFNLESMARHGTVEFRQHSGTVNGLKMVNWVKLVGGFVETAVNAKSIRQVGDGKFDNLLEVLPEVAVRKFYRERKDALARV
jgi:hypothetical protein